MRKPQIDNLEALVRGFELNIYQKADAKNELVRLKTYVYELEKKINNYEPKNKISY